MSNPNCKAGCGFLCTCEDLPLLPDNLAIIDRAELEALRAALGAMLTQFGMDEDEWNKPTFNQAREALRMFDIVRAIKDLPRFSFLSPKEGGVKRWENASGDWIERHEVMLLIEQHIEAQALNEHRGEAVLIPNGYEIYTEYGDFYRYDKSDESVQALEDRGFTVIPVYYAAPVTPVGDERNLYEDGNSHMQNSGDYPYRTYGGN